jgi:hypothetical protein
LPPQGLFSYEKELQGDVFLWHFMHQKDIALRVLSTLFCAENNLEVRLYFVEKYDKIETHRKAIFSKQKSPRGAYLF